MLLRKHSSDEAVDPQVYHPLLRDYEAGKSRLKQLLEENKALASFMRETEAGIGVSLDFLMIQMVQVRTPSELRCWLSILSVLPLTCVPLLSPGLPLLSSVLLSTAEYTSASAPLTACVRCCAQRVPRYVLLLGELVKHTPPALEEELAELRKLQETIRAACDAIDAAVAGEKA